MSKTTATATSRGWFGRKTRHVTVMAANVEANYDRKAKAGFWVTTLVVGLISAAIAASTTHPILALLLGAAVGTVCGAPVWVAIRTWPVVRRVWWWLPEIVLALVVGYGFMALSAATDVVTRIVVLALVVGVPAAIGPVRRTVVGLYFCLASRHRLRQLFTDVIKSNHHGSLPLILWARPTPVGERVWLLLRPGLCKTDLTNRLEHLAVACKATTVMVEQPGANAAFIQVDIKRRDVLTATVGSPLVGMVDPNTPTVRRHAPIVPTDLNLADVPLVKFIPDSAGTRKTAGKPDAATTATTNGSRKTADDDNEWI